MNHSTILKLFRSFIRRIILVSFTQTQELTFSVSHYYKLILDCWLGQNEVM